MKKADLKNPIAGLGTDALTQEQRPVIKGEVAFFLMDSQGLPFDILLDVLKEHGYAFDFVGFAKAAKQSKNFTRERLELLFSNNAPNSYDYPDFLQQVQTILDVIYETENS
jgi:alanyl-tRNA synthetase